MLYVKIHHTEFKTLNWGSTGSSSIVKQILKLSREILMICMLSSVHYRDYTALHWTSPLNIFIFIISPCKPWPLVAGHISVSWATVSDCILRRGIWTSLFTDWTGVTWAASRCLHTSRFRWEHFGQKSFPSAGPGDRIRVLLQLIFIANTQCSPECLTGRWGWWRWLLFQF